tara:strand:+ start:1885 stop:2373 length:489 start_codon:yes stop_codon:yes gene_type:complete
MKKIICISVFLFLTSCGGVDFVYMDKKNITNPLYEKTKINISGAELVFMNSYLPMLFGDNKYNEFNMFINIKEKKTKTSVEKNQATSNLMYELRFQYSVFSNTKECKTYEKEILSNFSIIPKSGGYNYGTDASLEKKYELAITENLNQFISVISGLNINDCS